MNANAFRHFYDYNFTENRKIWDSYVTQLSPEQFTQHVGYSHGSVRDQIVHPAQLNLLLGQKTGSAPVWVAWAGEQR